MKIKGKVGEFTSMLRRTSVDGIFDPVLYKVSEKGISTRMYAEGQVSALFAKFGSFDVECDGEEELVVDTQELLEQMAPLNSQDDFTLERGSGVLKISTEKEFFKFHTSEDWEKKAIDADSIPIDMNDDISSFKGDELDVRVKMKSSEWSKAVSRTEVSGAEFIELKVEDNQVKSYIGDLNSDEYNPRRLDLNGELVTEGENSVRVGFGLQEFSGAFSGKMFFDIRENFPMIVSRFNQDKKEKVVYLIAPVEDIE